MAEAPPVIDKGLKDLREEVTCPVCHDFFDEPKILPCCHYYCKHCIEALAKTAGPNQPFNCPECRVATLLPQNDPNKLPTAFFVNRMKEVHSKMEKAEGKVEARCEQCHEGVSVAFCRQCTEFICDYCVKCHKKLKVYSGHKVMTLEEVKKGGAKQILVTKPPPPNCTIHDEPMKAYCFDCGCLICRDCIVINHASHKSEFTKVAAPETKQLLLKNLAPLTEIRANLCKAAEVVQVTKSEVMAQGASVAENIEHSFQELQEIIDQHKNRLLEEATKKVEEKVSRLSTQEKGLNTASAVIQSLEDFVEQNLENATDEELITIHKQTLDRIIKEAEEHRKKAIDLDPVEIADLKVEVSCAETINRVCQTNAHLYQPLKYTVDGPGLNSAELNQQTHVVVQTMLHNDTPTKKSNKVTAKLKSLVSGSVVHLQGVQKRENMYEINFSSNIRGRHHLEINVNDRPIAGSPFRVYVKVPPTKLGKPVRVIPGLRSPYGVTVNSDKEVLVTEHRSIAVFDKSGRKLRDIKLSTDNVNILGIAVDEDNNMYVTDNKNNCLMKLNKAGELLKTVGKKGSAPCEFNYPIHVAVTRNKVFVCDKNNSRIQVFTRERLQFVESIGLECPTAITLDKLDNLYISDWTNSCVWVCNSNGKFQHFFKKKANNQLYNPHGVCVVDEFIYVVEFRRNCVSVFSRDGQFVTSFGVGGKQEGQFSSPCGICVDSDGFVYVCDNANNRVQVF